jgi:nucleolar protein 4
VISTAATDVHLGKTLFIRNIAYATTEEDLKAKLEAYGPLRYCVFVKDRASGEPNGSAFVQYTAPTGADKCLTEAYRSKAFKKQKPTNTLRDLESDIVVDGRRLIITKAVDRKEAKQMTDTRKKNRDKRNLYLASEGVIKPNTEAAQELAKEEMQKRMRGQHGKNLKVSSPFLHYASSGVVTRVMITSIFMPT